MELSMPTIKRLLLAVSMSCLVATANAAPFDDAVAAYNRGDYAQALKILRSLAAQGNADAQTTLGGMYYSGERVPQDYHEAVKWWKLAAAQGEVSAQFLLGSMYSDGEGVAQNYREALKWYRLAAEQGNAQAIANLKRPEMIAAAQNSTPDRRSTSIKTGANAAPFDDAVAAYKRGDYAQAFKIFRPLAAQGNADAQTVIGAMYSSGEGITQDYQEALKWFRLAAAQGIAEAQYNIGQMYREGQGVIQDYKEAGKWYRLAAEQGYANAQFNLGVMYSTGQGVIQDYASAHMWYNLASSAGQANGAKNRDIIAKKMTPQQIEKAQDMARACQARNFKGC